MEACDTCFHKDVCASFVLRGCQHYHSESEVAKRSRIRTLVVYGEWIAPTNGVDNPDEWRECSRCGNLIDVHFPTALPKFCEECGAKMMNGGERDD